VRAALREAIEECAIDPRSVRVHGVVTDDHGGWTYQTVLASAAAPLAAAAVSQETSEVAWVPVAEVERLRLHPGFAGQWPVLRTALAPLTVIVDTANVMGSRPDGWWRDRAAAARRLHGQIEGLAMSGVTDLPDSVQAAAVDRWFPRFIMVLEGAAAAGAEEDSTDRQVRIVRASGSGDDEIVRQAMTAGARLVVTADRELRGRCEAVGAAVVGPRWLLGLL